MGKMAMEHPVTEAIGYELDIPSLSYTNQHGVSARPDCLGLTCSLPAGFPKCESMQMHRMVVHSEVDDPDANAFTVANNERCGCRTRLTVESQPVELHVHAVRDC